MNKKVLTLCAGALLAGGVSLAYVAPVNAALPAITAVAAAQEETAALSLEEFVAMDGVSRSGNVITISKTVTLPESKFYLLIDEANVTLVSQNEAELNGRIAIIVDGVTVDGLTINNTVKTNLGSFWKNGITVVASEVTLTNNTIVCGVAKDATSGAMANGISIFPTAETVEYNIAGNTIEAANVITGQWQSSGILISEGTAYPNDAAKKTSVLKDFDASKIAKENSFDECAGDLTLYNYTERATGYKYISVTPLKDQSGKIQNESYITSMITDAVKDATVIFNGTSADLLAALQESEEDLSSGNAAVQCSDKNLLFGNITEAPDNGKASSNVVLDNGQVTDKVQTSATPYIGSYALLEKDGDGFYLLGVLGTDGKTQYVVSQEGNLVVFKDEYAANPKYLWDMQETYDPVNKVYTYRFQNKADGNIYLKSTDDAGTGTGGSFSQISGAAYNSGLYMNVGASAADGPLNKAEANYWGLYESGEKAFEADYLNDLEGASFALTIKDNTGKKDVLQGAEAFGSSIVAVPDDNATSYQFMVGDKYIVLDTEDKWSDNGIAPDKLGYKFKTISEDVLNKDTKGRYMSTFSIKYLAGDNTDKDAEPTNKTAIERITVTSKDGKTTYSLATYNSDGKDYLTVASAKNENLYAVISFGSGNRTDITTLLTGKFATIEFVNKEYKTYADGETVDKNQQYKMDKMLAMEADKNGYNLQAEYIGTTKAEYPEAQWAISMNDDNTATFTNRENPDVKVEHVVLYNTDVDDVYAITSVNGDGDSNYATYNVAAKDTIKLTFVTTGMFDGFKYVDLAGLQDTVYNIAAFKAVNEVNDAYWVEKNHSTTHQIGLDGDIENAGEWNLHVAMKQQLDGDGEVVKDAKGDPVMVPDTVFVKSTLFTWDAAKKTAKPSESVLAIFPYEIQNNANGEYVRYDYTHGVEYYVADKSKQEYMADHFALKIQPDGYHIVTLESWGSNEELMKPYENYENEVLADRNWVTRMGEKVFAGNAASRGTLDKIANYTSVYNDVMTITPVAMPEYRPVVKANESAFDTVRIYRDENHSQLLYEKKDAKSVVEKDTLSFLNIDNENQFELADAIFVDTAYVNRGTNTCWQYLLVVQPKNVSEWYCPVNEEHNTEAWREANGVEHCHDAIRKNYVEGRFLINLMDTANVYETTTQHDNPYIHEVEAGDVKAKLAFVPGKHFGDTLVIYKDAAMTQVKDSLFLGDKDFNIAKFAFRYEDNATQSFKIQTQYKKFKYGNLKADDYVSNDGYLRWVNGTVVVDEGYDKGDVFNMTESYEGNPTANEEISANAAVSVVATDGAVIVKGAEGKNVIVSTILGKVVANEVLNSDNETIAAPAGIVVVSVDGESFKVAVK